MTHHIKSHRQAYPQRSNARRAAHPYGMPLSRRVIPRQRESGQAIVTLGGGQELKFGNTDDFNAFVATHLLDLGEEILPSPEYAKKLHFLEFGSSLQPPDRAIVKIVIEDGFAEGILTPQAAAPAPEHSFVSLANCYYLQELRLPEFSNFSLGRNALRNCYSLHKLHWPMGARSVGRHAFRNCMSLPKITIPEGVLGIEHEAFAYCISLRNFTVPDSVAEIADCFTPRMTLSDVDIPDSLPVFYLYRFRSTEQSLMIRFTIRPVRNRDSDWTRFYAAEDHLRRNSRLAGLLDSGGGHGAGMHPLRLALHDWLRGPVSVLGIQNAIDVIERAQRREREWESGNGHYSR